jgi:hypothetical protein
MRSLTAPLSIVATLLGGLLLAPCEAQVTLSWSPSPSSAAAGYYLCWGTNSHVYNQTNTYTGLLSTKGIITGLSSNQGYFFAVQAFATNGAVSPFSNEAAFTNGPPVTSQEPPASGPTAPVNAPIFVTETNGPPALPGGGGLPSQNGPSQVNNGGSSSPVVSGNGGASISGGNSAPTNSAANFWGVPPFLTMIVSNGQPNMNIGGTVGANVMIQASTNPWTLDSWETMTNVTLTNIAAVAQGAQASQAQDILDLAFVPAAQAFPVPSSNSAVLQLFRVVMPYDYAILASIVLKGQGYTPRLILVNMPGIVHDDACYVNEATSFIHYNWTNAALQLQSSRPSIRQIANTLANSLSLDWTSASEFSYSNGLGQILATVVETEPPSSDPVAGQSPPSQPMVIDF